jgi:hypothetical protein
MLGPPSPKTPARTPAVTPAVQPTAAAAAVSYGAADRSDAGLAHGAATPAAAGPVPACAPAPASAEPPVKSVLGSLFSAISADPVASGPAAAAVVVEKSASIEAAPVKTASLSRIPRPGARASSK